MTPQRKRQSQRKVADALFSKLVRSVGYCEMAGPVREMQEPEGVDIVALATGLAIEGRASEIEAAITLATEPQPVKHGGGLQCAHVISRRYLPIRWDRMNAMCLCAAHHVYFTHHPLEFEDWCREQLGSAVYQELRRTALKGGRPEYPALIADLRARLEASAA